MQSIKTWQERTGNHTIRPGSTKHMIAEIADLRAALSAQAAAPVDLPPLPTAHCSDVNPDLQGFFDYYTEDQMHAYARAALAHPVAVDAPTCKCDMRTKLLGDGCSVCNPELAARCAAENAEDTADARLEYLYQLACVKPFIAPITTKEKWLASIDAAVDAQGKAS